MNSLSISCDRHVTYLSTNYTCWGHADDKQHKPRDILAEIVFQSCNKPTQHSYLFCAYTQLVRRPEYRGNLTIYCTRLRILNSMHSFETIDVSHYLYAPSSIQCYETNNVLQFTLYRNLS